VTVHEAILLDSRERDFLNITVATSNVIDKSHQIDTEAQTYQKYDLSGELKVYYKNCTKGICHFTYIRLERKKKHGIQA